jgi:hypothetical protein
MAGDASSATGTRTQTYPAYWLSILIRMHDSENRNGAISLASITADIVDVGCPKECGVCSADGAAGSPWHESLARNIFLVTQSEVISTLINQLGPCVPEQYSGGPVIRRLLFRS